MVGRSDFPASTNSAARSDTISGEKTAQAFQVTNRTGSAASAGIARSVATMSVTRTAVGMSE